MNNKSLNTVWIPCDILMLVCQITLDFIFMQFHSQEVMCQNRGRQVKSTIVL